MIEEDIIMIDVDENGDVVKKRKEDFINEIVELYEDYKIDELEDLAETFSDRAELWKEDNPQMAHLLFDLQKTANHYIQLYYMEY